VNVILIPLRTIPLGERVRAAEYAKVPKLHFGLASCIGLAGFHCVVRVPKCDDNIDLGFDAKPRLHANCLVSKALGVQNVLDTDGSLLQGKARL